MKSITSKLVLLLLVAPMVLLAQTPKPAPEIKAFNEWLGNWTCTGTAKNEPNDKEHPLTWRLHGYWILSGFAVQYDHEWIESGTTTKSLEIINFDPAKKSLISTGYGDDGSSWISTLTLKGDIWIEKQKITLPDGKILSESGRYTLSPNHLSMTATVEAEKDGLKWTAYQIKGTKTPLKSRP